MCEIEREDSSNWLLALLRGIRGPRLERKIRCLGRLRQRLRIPFMLNLAQAKIFYIISKPSNRVASKRSNVALLSRRLRGNVHFGRILLLSIHLFCYISYLSRSVRKRVFLPIHSTREAGAALQLSSEQQTAAAELPFPSSSSSSLPDRLLPDRRRSMPKATAAASYIWG